SVGDGRTMPDETIVRRLARQLREAKRPVLFCGPQTDSKLAAPLAMLACVLRAPLLVDPLSQVRWGPHERSALIDRYDAALHHEPTAAALEPDLVMRMGSAPTSKSLLQYIQRHAMSRHVVVDASRWPDPTLLAAEVVRSDPRLLVTALLEQLESEGSAPSANSAWLERWRRVNAAAAAALGEYGDSVAEPFEGCALSEIAAAVPAGGTLFASSSMPVRDLDAFASGDERPIRVLANRGANGIDGVMSTALGVAAATGETSPLVLVLGDLAFIHDMNGLIAAKLHELDATIVVVNNDGGGIFSFLPQSRDAEHFEQLFGTPHGLTFRSAAEFHGASYQLVSSHSGLRKVVAAGVDAGGLHIIEL